MRRRPRGVRSGCPCLDGFSAIRGVACRRLQAVCVLSLFYYITDMRQYLSLNSTDPTVIAKSSPGQCGFKEDVHKSPISGVFHSLYDRLKLFLESRLSRVTLESFSLTLSFIQLTSGGKGVSLSHLPYLAYWMNFLSASL